MNTNAGQFDAWHPKVMQLTKGLPSTATSASPETEEEPMRHVSLGDIESYKERQAQYEKERDEK